jgi:cobalt-precorrin-5B (C1)-methyltransferase
MKKLRSGYTTGACAAAAAKGATLHLFGRQQLTEVEIPFPDGRRVRFTIEQCVQVETTLQKGCAGTIKDAGDDPDVTNGALIQANVWISADGKTEDEIISIKGGEGVGTVTKPGLALPIGAPAINPVPLKMIRDAVIEAMQESCALPFPAITVEISVPRGRELAGKTLNERLGIVDGISILGTTGIVRPISAEAWTATISSAMDVAAAGGSREIVLSTGRTSEAALQKAKKFKPEAFIMMGDYLEFALNESSKYPFTRLHMAGMWAKILKAALHIPQTHVRFGALEVQNAITRIAQLNPDKDIHYLEGANTAREIYERLTDKNDRDVIVSVCSAAKEFHQKIAGLPVTLYLVHHNGSIPVIVE